MPHFEDYGRLEELRNTKELIAEINNQHGNEVYCLTYKLSDIEQAWVESDENDIATFIAAYEANRAKWKINLPGREVEQTFDHTLYTVNLRPFIEQMVTEQVMKVLNSVEYQARALNTLYPPLFSEHPPIHPTEQQKSEHPHDNPVQEMNTILNTLYSALAGEQRSYSVDLSTEQQSEED